MKSGGQRLRAVCNENLMISRPHQISHIGIQLSLFPPTFLRMHDFFLGAVDIYALPRDKVAKLVPDLVWITAFARVKLHLDPIIKSPEKSTRQMGLGNAQDGNPKKKDSATRRSKSILRVNSSLRGTSTGLDLKHHTI